MQGCHSEDPCLISKKLVSVKVTDQGFDIFVSHLYGSYCNSGDAICQMDVLQFPLCTESKILQKSTKSKANSRFFVMRLPIIRRTVKISSKLDLFFFSKVILIYFLISLSNSGCKLLRRIML